MSVEEDRAELARLQQAWMQAVEDRDMATLERRALALLAGRRLPAREPVERLPAHGLVDPRRRHVARDGAPLVDPRLVLRVVVEPAAGFAAEQARLDHPVQQRGRDGAGVAELLVERLADRE